MSTESPPDGVVLAQCSRPGLVDRVLFRALAAYGAAALIALALTPRFFLPAEDAVILFQYSRNLAQHGAITFLAGGPHTEGATDFAWMALLALAERCGLPPFPCTALLNLISLRAGIAAILTAHHGVAPAQALLLEQAHTAGGR